jgi:hypothetical protein
VYHRKQPALRNHTVVGIEYVRTQAVKTSPLVEKCRLHQGKSLKFYCVDHNALCCSNCVAADHRKCDKVETSSQRANELRSSDAHNDLVNMYTVFSDHSTNLVNHVAQSKERSETQKEGLRQDIKSTREDMFVLLNNLEALAYTEIEGAHKEEKLQLEDRKDACSSLQKALQNSHAVLQTAIDHGSDSHLLQTFQTLKDDMPRYEQKLKTHHCETVDTEYTFTVQEQLNTLLQSLNTIGKVEIRHTPAHLGI